MGSTRLPGKVCREVLGTPLIEYEIERLRLCESVDAVVLATSDLPADDPVAEVGKRLGTAVCRGSESDVLDRYRQAARQQRADIVMRVTGDCPLLDPAVCDRSVRAFLDSGADYLCTSPRVAEGLDCEVMTSEALDTAWREAALDSEREHVTLYLRNHPEKFRCASYEPDRDDSGYRVTVDEPEDFEVVKAVLEALVPAHGLAFSFDEVRRFLDANPEIMALNGSVIRNQGLITSMEKENDPS